MDMVTVASKGEAQALADIAIDKGFKYYKIVKLSDCFLLIAYT
jgi:hypothetical protein